MKLICKIFGHNIKVAYGSGINPRLMQVIDRKVTYCQRKGCDYRQQEDHKVRDNDIKNGLNLWGSGGVCMGCSHYEICNYSSRSKSYMMEHCPINNFAFKNEGDRTKLESWGDTLIG